MHVEGVNVRCVHGQYYYLLPSGPQTYSILNLCLCLLLTTRDIPCEPHCHDNNTLHLFSLPTSFYSYVLKRHLLKFEGIHSNVALALL